MRFYGHKIAIQGELGSNSHAAALQVFSGHAIELESCALSAEVFERLENGSVDAAVLPIENSLHGSVLEHYDLLLQSSSIVVVAETTLHIRHDVIAAPGVRLEDVRRVMSHPVALSQCRRWLRDHPEIEAVPFYDTAGSIKHVVQTGLRDAAGIAPALAAIEYGAQVMVAGIEDHPENYTRFYVLARETEKEPPDPPNKASLAFSVEHRPGSLIEALEVLRGAGLNLTKIESRPVHGRPWEYVFFIDVRFGGEARLDRAIAALRVRCEMVRELGRYRATANLEGPSDTGSPFRE